MVDYILICSIQFAEQAPTGHSTAWHRVGQDWRLLLLKELPWGSASSISHFQLVQENSRVHKILFAFL